MKDQELIELTRQLLDVLDADAQYLGQGILLLDQLRQLLVRHELAGLEAMLNQIRTTVDTHSLRELARTQLRGKLAGLLGCSAQQVTISTLAASLPQPWKDRLIYARANLQGLTKRLRQEYYATAMLLADCARFNQSLLASILQDDECIRPEYPIGNSGQWVSRSRLVNVRL
ncbi:MAG: hypothetical protein QHH07_04870 [Sedimentisphaerales bacterium]|jgi:hypothetical protein|nr:hypothetical protein [Sedimentisphaerales bacterium]